MKKQTLAIDTPFQKGDAYGALSMPVYHTLTYEFDNASVMSDAFCGRIEEPDYSRVMNPTVNYLELKIEALTGLSALQPCRQVWQQSPALSFLSLSRART